MKKIRLGTRGSKLALKQADIVSHLMKEELGLEADIVIIKTSGDKIQDKPLYDIRGKALFIKELELALMNDEIDIAIHSLKDVPGKISDEFEIAAMLEREDPRDVLVSKIASSIKDLPQGAKIGTSSPRRIMYLKEIRPDLDIQPIRGNIDTRLSKIREGQYDATILAYGGLKRLYGEIDSSICHPINIDEMLPAVGQGVIALEIGAKDEESRKICQSINHNKTFDLVSIERAFLEEVDADCKSPVAAFVREVQGGKVGVDFMLADEDWKKILSYSCICDLKDAKKLAIITAKKLKQDIDDNN